MQYAQLKSHLNAILEAFDLSRQGSLLDISIEGTIEIQVIYPSDMQGVLEDDPPEHGLILFVGFDRDDPTRIEASKRFHEISGIENWKNMLSNGHWIHSLSCDRDLGLVMRTCIFLVEEVLLKREEQLEFNLKHHI